MVHGAAKRRTRLRTFILTFSAEDARDASSIPGSGRPLGEGNGNPLQYSCLKSHGHMGFHGVSKSWTWLNNWTTSQDNTRKTELWWGLTLMEQSNHHILKISNCFPFPIKKISNSYIGTVSEVKQKLLSGNSPPLCPFSKYTFLQFNKVTYHYILFYLYSFMLH